MSRNRLFFALKLAFLLTGYLFLGRIPISSQEAPPFQVVANFNDLSAGNIDLQGEWHANEPGAAAGALVDVSPPLVFEGNALRNNPNNILGRGNAYLSLGANQLAVGELSTLFFQVAIDDPDNSNFSVGLSGSAQPNILTTARLEEYAVELNFSSAGLRVRDGDTYRTATNIQLVGGQLTHIWLAIDHAQSRFQVYVGNKTLNQPQLLEAGVSSGFAFRNGEPGPLLTFAIQNVGLNYGDSYIDNIAVARGLHSLEAPAPAFRLLDDFETVILGDINGQKGWVSSSTQNGRADVVADPLSNAGDNVGRNPESSGQVVALSGIETVLHKAMPIPEAATGTIHFRLRRSGIINAFMGGAATAAPLIWAEFEPQFGTQSDQSATFVVRDGIDFRALGSRFNDNTWYCIWLVINNPADTYQAYVRGGDYGQITQLNGGGSSDFGLRNGGDSALQTFFARNGVDSTGTLYIDDIYYDPNAANLTQPGEGCGAVEVPNSGSQPVADPIPATIQPDGTTVHFETIVTLPPTAVGEMDPRGNPLTRLNFGYHARDGSGRLFANDLRGSLYAVYPAEKRFVEYLNIKGHFPSWFEERGLNSGFSTFAFHPDYATNGLLYTIHTEVPNGLPDFSTFAPRIEAIHSVLVEWKSDDPAADTFIGETKRELLRIEQSDVLHGMQLVQFNPLAEPGDADYGLLYVSNGDGENSPRYTDAAQSLESLQGALIRIDPAGTDSLNGRYGIPPGNPLYDRSDNAILKEIYAYGFRNPNRFAWDPVTCRLLLADIGQNNVEEINLIVPGANYGWNEREGTFVFNKADPGTVLTLPADDGTLGYTYPVAQYDHDDGFAIMGGFVYRGTLMPHMVGKYIFGDIVQGHLFYVNIDELIQGQLATIHKLALADESGTEVNFKSLVDPLNQRADLRFGMDEAGEIYIMSKQDGVVRRLISSSGETLPPTTQSTAQSITPSSSSAACETPQPGTSTRPDMDVDTTILLPLIQM